MTNDDLVLYSLQQQLASITLNRPQARNALNAAMRQGLLVAIERALADAEVRVLLLNGAGLLFCAGGDLAELQSPDFLPQAQLEDEYKPLLLRLAQAPKPVLCALQGPAAEIGAALALACDLLLMADDASLYLPFSQLGLIPDGGVCWHLLHSLGRKRAYELIVSGAKMPAQQCLALGLVNRLVPAATLPTAAQAWSTELAQRAPQSMRYAKQALNQLLQLDLADAISYEAALQNRCLLSVDGREGLAAFVAKRQPLFQGQ